MDTLTVDLATVLSSLLGMLVVGALVGVAFALATDDRDPSVVLAWLFVILLVPVLGVVAYFFIGRNYRRETRRRHAHRAAMAELAERSLSPVVTAAQTFTEAAVKGLQGTPGQRLESTGRHEGGSVVLPADDVRLYFNGEDKFHDLFVDMKAARQHIHLMYLIWERDELTAKVTDLLLEGLRAGVEVRILYDWLSSLPYKKDELKRLSAAGAIVVPCYKRLRQLNYRNHMKMAIIDGETVYSGGMNMGQEYIDGGERFDVWRDTHFRMTGPAVAPYLALFATTWLLTGRSEDLFTAYMSPPSVHGPGEGVPVQVLHSSVSTQFPTIRDVYVAGLVNARERVWVQSPYFVPDEPLVTAMCVAASSGVEVRFMMTGVPDKKLPFYAAHAYYKKLLDAGVRVYQYKAGFLHAKTVTVDDEVAIIGTCNWDIRSIILHDEVVSLFYDHEIARTCADRYEQDITDCVEVTLDDLSALNPLQRLRNSVYRLTSRLL
ncbi:MAG TPA: cardiolipin synthase [Nocardioidaceae bacterium]|nr:cardiolipin synthase [Nocardioidaceae bacterium]